VGLMMSSCFLGQKSLASASNKGFSGIGNGHILMSAGDILEDTYTDFVG
jgi:hypothetical protein